MRNLALVFPGQGCQYVGMGKEFFEKYSLVKKIFEEANEYLGIDLQKLIFEGDIQELTKTENAQPAILTVCYAMFKTYMERYEIIPQYSAGHSLGELTALTCSGSIDFKDAIILSKKRGQFMKEAADSSLGAMAAINGIDVSLVEEECRKHSSENFQDIVVVSNYNSMNQTVISGYKHSVKEVSEKLSNKGSRVVPLNVSGAFHSPLMKVASERFKKELEKYTYYDTRWPVISNVNAVEYKDKNDIIKNLSMQMVKPVQWVNTINLLKIKGIQNILEIGPNTVLGDLIKKEYSKITVLSYDKVSDVETLNMKLNGRNTLKLGDLIIRCLSEAVCTKNMNWNVEEYQKGVVEPYNKIQQIQEEYERTEQEPTIEKCKEVLSLFFLILNTKKTPKNEIERIIEEISIETGVKELIEE
ncbi:ACP S-malonyltransferase [Clostridium estertheticum]|uniref:ACP S-malonyltransferase n=1 Tax=Clostridium estertheticum TaxID=238834 RepID=UPI001C0D576C|nr:ACP S-malonyltransferase [Clostridium estertheticum]MBU3198526.1 ACP S-malonyltransferase [Clostridium estertheticum]WAG64507.1 ACP S-malonyltransferase [Clostridium estertheticum]